MTTECRFKFCPDCGMEIHNQDSEPDPWANDVAVMLDARRAEINWDKSTKAVTEGPWSSVSLAVRVRLMRRERAKRLEGFS